VIPKSGFREIAREAVSFWTEILRFLQSEENEGFWVTTWAPQIVVFPVGVLKPLSSVTCFTCDSEAERKTFVVLLVRGGVVSCHTCKYHIVLVSFILQLTMANLSPEQIQVLCDFLQSNPGLAEQAVQLAGLPTAAGVQTAGAQPQQAPTSSSPGMPELTLANWQAAMGGGGQPFTPPPLSVAQQALPQSVAAASLAASTPQSFFQAQAPAWGSASGLQSDSVLVEVRIRLGFFAGDIETATILVGD
jgi:hypothetical protein